MITILPANTQIMACSPHARSNISMDLFNLPSLLDERRSTTMISEFPNDFFLPDGKNSRICQIINNCIFSRQTLDGNEGIGVEIPYLEHAYNTKYYIVNQINGNICAIHDNSIESTDFFGCFGPFNLKELECDVCRIADCHNVDNSRLDDNRRQVPQEVPALQESAQHRQLRPFHELQDMVHDR